MVWQHGAFQELDGLTLYRILQLRVDVFVVEQNCPYPELDGKDLAPDTIHLFLPKDDKILAYGRILAPGISYPDHPSLGRICVAQGARQLALGKELVKRSIELAEQHWPDRAIRISAQCYLQRFYESFGFVACGEPYLEDNIPHIEMLRP